MATKKVRKLKVKSENSLTVVPLKNGKDVLGSKNKEVILKLIDRIGSGKERGVILVTKFDEKNMEGAVFGNEYTDHEAVIAFLAAFKLNITDILKIGIKI